MKKFPRYIRSISSRRRFFARSMSTNIILHNIGASERVHAARSICDGLVNSRFQNTPLCEAFSDLYKSQSSDMEDAVADLKTGLTKLLSNPVDLSSATLASMALLGRKIPYIGDFLLKSGFEVFEKAAQYNLISGFESSSEGECTDEQTVIAYLTLIDLLNIDNETAKTLPQAFIFALTSLQASSSKEISSLAGKSLGSLVGKIPLTDSLQKFWWSCVQNFLQQSVSEHYYVIGFKLWIRWVSRYDLSENRLFQSILDDNQYWSYLQLSLQEKYKYNCKKFGLHILSKSIQSISHDISLPIMTWNDSARDQYLLEWRRYITLIEIVGIDASLNQAEASQADILHILNTSKSLIPTSWGLVLLSVGLTSTMDSIRRLISGLILSMDLENTALLSESESLLHVLLGFCTQAGHFSTVDLGGRVTCAYAETLMDFTARLVNLSDDVSSLEITKTVLSFINENSRIHDPARIYLILGLAKGLQNRNILDSEALQLVEKLATTSFVESYLRENAIWCGYVKLFLEAAPEKISFEQWFSSLSTSICEKLWIKSHLGDDINRKSTSWGSKIIDVIDPKKCCDPVLYYSVYCHQYAKYPDTFDISLNVFPQAVLQDSKLGSNLVSNKEFQAAFKRHCTRAYESSTEIADDFYLSVKEAQNFGISIEEIFVKSDCTQIEFPSELRELSWKIQKLDLTKEVPSKLSLKAFCERFRATNILRLGDGRRYREDAVTSFFNILSQYHISDAAEFDILLEEILFYFPMTKKNARVAALKCLQTALHKNTNVHDMLVPELHGLWKVFIEERLSARERDLHHLFLAIAFSKDNMESESNEELAEIAESVVKQSYGRRSLLPQLAQLLYPYSDIEWVKYVFVHVYTLQRLNVPTYTIEPTIGQTLDECLGWPEGTSYAQEWGSEEISARALALAHISNIERPAAVDLFDYFLSGKDYKPFQILKRNNAEEKRVKVAVLQLMLALERHIPSDILARSLSKFYWPALDPESSLAARLYLEWTIARYISRDAHSGIIEEKLFKPLLAFDGIPRIIVSLERIALLVLNCESDEGFYSKFVAEYLSLLIPLATSNKSGVRHSSVAMMHSLRAELDKPGKEIFKQKMEAYLPILDGVVRTVVNHDSDNKFRKGTDTVWSLHDDLTLVGIAGHVLVKVLDECPVIPITREDFQRALAPFKEIETGIPIGEESGNVWTPPKKENSDVMRHELESTGLSQQLQTKSGAWMSSSVDDDDSDTRVNIQRGNMIVLASLVNKAPNLGGICRLSDVLGAELLCLNEMSVCERHDFKSVAMTADQWMPMMEVKEEEILEFMRLKKMEGYILIGLEQTDNSIQLNGDFKFPEKCILLLGKEREGIPGNLLAELDMCIEIKQVGVVRSMNIQTATAVVVQAYSSQHC